MASIPIASTKMDDLTVRSLLEPDQLVDARQRALGRRKLSRVTLMLMWGLRVYAVFMFGIVAYQIAHAL
jgi:hypothetical protein